MNGFHELLDGCLQGRVCFMGLGNVDMGDDGFGVRLAERLSQGGWPAVIIASTSPEDYLGCCAGGCQDHLVFLDAVEFGGKPGSVVLLNSGEMVSRFPQISTHKLSLGLLAKCVEANGATKAWLLGVQPESLRPGRCLSAAVQNTLAALEELLLDRFQEELAR
jgi:hydrogenase 3 maturation protease